MGGIQAASDKDPTNCFLRILLNANQWKKTVLDDFSYFLYWASPSFPLHLYLILSTDLVEMACYKALQI